MATNRDPVIVDEQSQPNGEVRVRVQFLVAGRTLPRKVDSKIGERVFILDPDAQEVLREANQNIREAFKGLGGKDRPDLAPFDISMGVYLYTRKFKAPELPSGEILIDGKTMRLVAKKFVG